MPVPKSKPNATSRPDEQAADGGYAFPDRIVLDDASFEAFSAEVSNPGPNAALDAFFEKFKKKKLVP